MPLAKAGPPDRRGAFRARIERHSLRPFWEALGVPTPPHPAPACVPALWRYREVRPLVIEAARLIGVQDAERRALALENPGLRGAFSITHSLYAGLHTLLPGELASRHRHTRWSLRLLLEGDGAYTVHEGQRLAHRPGDFVVVAPWSGHDQGNAGGTLAVWLEEIEVPTVAPLESVPDEGRIGDSCATSLPGDAPSVGDALPPDSGSDATLLAYPYARTRQALASMRATCAPHPSHGFRMRCAAPPYAVPATLEAFVELLPAGFRGRPSRTTDSTVYCVLEGRGESRIGGQTLGWESRDIFVVPSWSSATHVAAQETVLIGYSDRPAQQALGLWREETLD